MPGESPATSTVKTPITGGGAALHSVHTSPQRPSVGLSVGFGDVLQQTPRRKSGGGLQIEVTRAPRVTEADLIFVAVGRSMVGGVGARQVKLSSSHILPKAHSALAVAVLISAALL